MLDSSKESHKLEAMKRIIGMIARGRDASDLFPAVVKNVVSKNIEIKKLVYVYLTRYAEEQQDLALLSISTFQRLRESYRMVSKNTVFFSRRMIQLSFSRYLKKSHKVDQFFEMFTSLSL